MGDSVYFIPGQTRTEYVTKKVNVTEKRAPTDDSLKLLKEMEEAARGNILDAFVIQDNTVNMSAVVLHDAQFDCKRVRYELKINGRKLSGGYKVELGFDYDRGDVFRKAVETLMAEAVDQVVADLAPVFLSGMR